MPSRAKTLSDGVELLHRRFYEGKPKRLKDLEAEGLPEHLALRLGCHLGPVFPTRDPVLEETVYMGSHVSRTARIEPVTPPGAVYVTEPFAAALVLDGRSRFACDYVGHMDAAKGYGRLRMYRLLRGQSIGDAPF